MKAVWMAFRPLLSTVSVTEHKLCDAATWGDDAAAPPWPRAGAYGAGPRGGAWFPRAPRIARAWCLRTVVDRRCPKPQKEKLWIRGNDYKWLFWRSRRRDQNLSPPQWWFFCWSPSLLPSPSCPFLCVISETICVVTGDCSPGFIFVLGF